MALNTHLNDLLPILKLEKIDDYGNIKLLDANKNVVAETNSESDSVKITIGDIVIELNGNNFCYQKKKPNTDYNSKLLRIYGNSITFFNSSVDNSQVENSGKNNQTSSSVEFDYDNNFIFYRMVKKHKIVDSSSTIVENEKYYLNEDGCPTKESSYSYFFHYDNDLSFRNGDINQCQPIFELADEEITKNSIIPEVFSDLESLFPGITDYLRKNYSIIDYIYKRMDIRKYKKGSNS